MGTFQIEVELLPAKIKVPALVDTGATFSKIPSHILEKLKVKIDFKTEVDPVTSYTMGCSSKLRNFAIISQSQNTCNGVELGDGRKIKRKVGYVRMKINGKAASVPVVFGEKGERSLLGATALEILGLVPEPRKKTLIESMHLEILSV